MMWCWRHQNIDPYLRNDVIAVFLPYRLLSFAFPDWLLLIGLAVVMMKLGTHLSVQNISHAGGRLATPLSDGEQKQTL